MMSQEQEKHQDVGKPEDIVLAWWRGLRDNKAERAQLRRAKTLEEVFFAPAFHRLYQQLGSTPWRSQWSIALLAGVLAHAEKHLADKPFAAQMARPGKSGSAARVSGLRLRRLLQQTDLPSAYNAFIRILRLMGRESGVNVLDLARSLYWWNDRTRRAWIFEYYSTNQAGD